MAGEGLEALATARVRMWTCLIPAHGERRGVVTVEWEDDVAHCTQEGCDLTSEHTDRFARNLRDYLAEQVEKQKGEHGGTMLPHAFATDCPRCGMERAIRIIQGERN